MKFRDKVVHDDGRSGEIIGTTSNCKILVVDFGDDTAENVWEDRLTLLDQQPCPAPANPYARQIYPLDGSKPVPIDVYRVIDAYEVAGPGVQHALKKILLPGRRGDAKSVVQDLEEAVVSLRQEIELLRQKGGA